MNFVRIGRRRLQIKLPHLRSELSSSRAGWFDNLFEAYGLAVLALEGFRQTPGSGGDLIREYETICGEIEQDMEKEITRLRKG
jgi:hypothetical protein